MALVWALTRTFQARRTTYFVTHERVFIVRSLWNQKCRVRSLELRRAWLSRRVQYADGSGDLVLNRIVDRSRGDDDTFEEEGLFAVSDVKSLEKFVHDSARRLHGIRRLRLDE